MARHLGARVIATASGEGIAFAKDLGADEVIDYKLQKFQDLVTGVDAVFDTVGGETYDKSFVVMKKGGVIVSMTTQPNKDLSEKFGVSAIYQSTHTSTEQLDRLAKLINEGIVTVRVDNVFTLDQIKEAFEARESGSVKGKLAIKIKD
jgi:NADPH:quinone reductase-like Zn-dependent oxidoreductase